jgi:hypothetical protein
MVKQMNKQKCPQTKQQMPKKLWVASDPFYACGFIYKGFIPGPRNNRVLEPCPLQNKPLLSLLANWLSLA